MYLYGILLEYIEGRSLLDIDFVKGLSTNKQIAAVRIVTLIPAMTAIDSSKRSFI